MEADVYNSSTWEAEAGDPQVRAQAALYNESLSQQQQRNKQ